MNFNPKALGFAFGLLFGGVWLIVMGVSLLTGFLDQTVQAVGGLHPGFTYTWMGLFSTVIMHLVGGFVGGFILAWLYNKFN
ncbi:MAG: hypothetical protein HYT27_02880 [Parcubacteria group bacterium]|nr:hypothetical protein [Parcubacteria group bacterium]